MSTPSQRHVIPLQGRPYENDQVRHTHAKKTKFAIRVDGSMLPLS